jgi:hypothetical protein
MYELDGQGSGLCSLVSWGGGSGCTGPARLCLVRSPMYRRSPHPGGVFNRELLSVQYMKDWPMPAVHEFR